MNDKIKLAIDKIFHDAAVAELKLINSGTMDKNFTYNDVLYLNIIEAHSGEYTASNIADMLCVSRPAVTQKINELEKNGYITKEQSKTDKRVFYLHENRNGVSQEYYKVIDKINENIKEKLTRKYSLEQINLFCEMTEDICKIIRKGAKKNDDDK